MEGMNVTVLGVIHLSRKWESNANGAGHALMLGCPIWKENLDGRR
jgi:hypothetical protein